MISGYKLFWSEKALKDLQNILTYLEENWTQRELKNFARKLEKRLAIITTNPNLFPTSNKKKNVRRSVLTKHTSIYYTDQQDIVTIITLFDTRQNPKKLKKTLRRYKS